jgi:hypothetical protein
MASAKMAMVPMGRGSMGRVGLEGVAMPPAAFAAFVAEQARLAQEIGRRVGRSGG